MKKRNLTIVKPFHAVPCLKTFFTALMFVLINTQVFAHSVQAAWCFSPDGDIRIYLEHWHGDFGSVPGASTIDVTIVVNGGAPMTSTLTASGIINNTTIGNLPCDPATPIQVLGTCAGQANTYNDWAYWDTSIPPDLCPGDGTVTVTVSNPNDANFADCGGLFPASVTSMVTCPENLCSLDVTCPTGPINLQCISQLPAGPTSEADFVALGGTINDSCNPVTVTFSDSDDAAAGCPAAPRTVTRTITVADPVTGESVDCPIDYVFADNTNPVITCPGDVTIECDEDDSPANTGSATATDNCGGTPTITFSDAITPGANAQEYTIQRTWTATDACGNSASCVQTITVVDTTAPSITCPGTQTINLDANCQASLPDHTGLGSTNDNCDPGPVITQSPNSGATLSNVGNETITLISTDASGNSTSCTFSLVKQDLIPPTPVCRENTVNIQPDGTYSLLDVDVLDFVSAIDNCSAVTVTNISPAAVDCDDFDLTLPISVTASDASGNTASCTALITVQKSTDLPAGYGHALIGGATGNALYDPCELTYCLEANGLSSFNNDKIVYAYQTPCGTNLEIIARVVSVSNGGWGGIIIRETMASDARKVAFKTHLNHFVRRDVRINPGGPVRTQQYFRPNDSWLRLVRSGNLFMGYTSSDGIYWKFTFFSSVNMSSCVTIGLFSEGPFANVPTISCFDNVSISGGVLPIVENGDGDWTTDEVRATPDFSIFPNPATDEVRVDLSQFENQIFSLKVLNNLGQIIYRKEYQHLEEYLESLDLSSYNNGIYLISIELEDGTKLTKKLIVH